MQCFAPLQLTLQQRHFPRREHSSLPRSMARTSLLSMRQHFASPTLLLQPCSTWCFSPCLPRERHLHSFNTAFSSQENKTLSEDFRKENLSLWQSSQLPVSSSKEWPPRDCCGWGKALMERSEVDR